ncbi:nucleoside diphosphate kinase regulator [Microvirga thermotolerans]|uniref:Nucleoside diphosphate kinase regulator n=1 Tax=Microvirga thermotolerans TaxID=2651334 RepID=A0A5P9JVB2_9HYPH|nr:nucleoside diphosphate kinase regulator [Microvirga thermotolerans]QFU16547.1 nucleoside diphosphate kinase regulator [Microvirga thermotolerans]
MSVSSSLDTRKGPSAAKRPPIAIRANDHERLLKLAEVAAGRMPEVAEYLLTELERARVVPPDTEKPSLVVMGSTVTFRDEQTGRTERVTLVYPDQADIDRKRISVLTPIGAALIGLSEGQSILWPTRTGKEHRLQVLKVEAEAAGGDDGAHG